jgi:hypothetical protein
MGLTEMDEFRSKGPAARPTMTGASSFQNSVTKQGNRNLTLPRAAAGEGIQQSPLAQTKEEETTSA